MKKTISIMLTVAMLICCFAVFSASIVTKVEAATRDLGTMYATKAITNNSQLWETDSSGNSLMNNHFAIIMPGAVMNGVWFHRLYAVYDSSKGGYVIQKKAGTFRNLSQTIASNAFGICFNFSPTVGSKGMTSALENWKTWCRLRVGDVLTLSGIDLTNKTVSTSGTWGSSDFKSNAKISCKTDRDEYSGTAYSNLTTLVLGDSVTCNGAWSEYLEDHIQGRVINAAIGGNRTQEALARFERDVTPWNPDVVLIMYAINDVIQYVYDDTTLPTFKTNLQTLYNKCKQIGVKSVIFMTPNDIKVGSLNYSRYANYGGVETCYKAFLNAIREVASANNCVCIDNYAKWVGLNRNDYLLDTVHPNSAGVDIYCETITQAMIDNCVKITGSPFEAQMALTEAAGKTCRITADDYLVGIKPNMTVAQLKALFSTNVSVEGSTVATGTKVNGLDGSGNIIKTVTIIIKGDINCDGAFDQSDVLKIKSIMKKTSTNDSAAALKAADTTGNGKITVSDYIAMKRHILNTYNLYA